MAVRNFLPLRYSTTRLFYIVEKPTELTPDLGEAGDIALHIPSGEEWSKSRGGWTKTGKVFGADILNAAQSTIDEYKVLAVQDLQKEADKVTARLLSEGVLEVGVAVDRRVIEGVEEFKAFLDVALNDKQQGITQNIMQMIANALEDANLTAIIKDSVQREVIDTLNNDLAVSDRVADKVTELAPPVINSLLTEKGQEISDSLDLKGISLTETLTQFNTTLRTETTQAVQVLLNEAATYKMVWVGGYSPTTPYKARQVVEFEGSSFICIEDCTGNPPPNISQSTQNQYWNLVSKKGAVAHSDFASDLEAIDPEIPNRAMSPKSTSVAIQHALDEEEVVLTEKLDDLKKTVPTKGVTARYGQLSKVAKIAVNESLKDGGGFPTTTETEFLNLFTGNNRQETLPPVAAMDLGEVLMTPPREFGLNFVAPNLPYLDTGTVGNSRIIPLEMKTILHGTAVSPALFEPVKTNAFGYLFWKYIGKEPIFTTIKGGFNLECRTSDTNPKSAARLILELGVVSGAPALEMGQNRGRRFLATCSGGLDSNRKINNLEEFNDPLPLLRQVHIDGAASERELFAGYDSGFIVSGSIASALVTTDAQGPVSPDVRTTKWMDLTGIDMSERILMFNLTGKSSVCYVQYKDASGAISYFSKMSFDGSAKRLIRLPSDAVAVRIHYSKRGDNVSAISCKALSAAVSAEYDVLKGYWANKSLEVCQQVVFWPNTVYYLGFLVNAYGTGASARSWGFRFKSGGLTFNFDAGSIKRKLANRMFKEI